MDNKQAFKRNTTILLVIAVIGIALGFATIRNPIFIILGIADLLAVFFAGLYLYKGYTKDARKFHRIYMLILSVTYFVQFFAFKLDDTECALTNVSITALIAIASSLGNLSLALGKDLGKQVSYLVNGILIGLFLALFIYSLVINITSLMIVYFILFALAVLTFILTVAKYKDKEARGSK